MPIEQDPDLGKSTRESGIIRNLLGPKDSYKERIEKYMHALADGDRSLHAIGSPNFVRSIIGSGNIPPEEYGICKREIMRVVGEIRREKSGGGPKDRRLEGMIRQSAFQGASGLLDRQREGSEPRGGGPRVKFGQEEKKEEEPETKKPEQEELFKDLK